MSYSSEQRDDEQLAIPDDLETLRQALVGELQAINPYHGRVLVLENGQAVTTLEHTIEQEKEHVAELARRIQRLDPVQAD